MLLDKELNCAKDKTFSRIYPFINKYLWEEGVEQVSRYGNVREILNFKTIIENPVERCTGGFGRNINIFFLLAEALWIWCGSRDVKFLAFFNSRIKEFSDDGVVFHAPYGYRLRYFGKDRTGEHIDQILLAIKMLSENPEDRRVVMQIWDAELDLNVKSLDIPCNDLVMLKIRENKLLTTISNRSNDLHWGLPTNVFQFSFISELISSVLGITQGDQVHNSQSLHFYTNNPIAKTIYRNYKKVDSYDNLIKESDLYNYSRVIPFKFNFISQEPIIRLDELDIFAMNALTQIKLLIDGYKVNEKFEEELREFSVELYNIYNLLKIYVEYKKAENKNFEFNTLKRRLAVEKINKLFSVYEIKPDICVLALNFFYRNLKDQNEKILGTF